MPKQFCIVNIQDGKIVNKTPLVKMLWELKAGKYQIEISPVNKRSLPQNRYLHGILIPEFKKALNEVGYDEVKTNSQAKDIMKSMFLVGEAVNKQTGEMIKYIRHTSDLNKEELNILIDDVIKFAAVNMNYQIAYPNEQLMMKYE